jgi:predicted DNA-binding protein (MmcQ/YjbR family)
MSLTKLAQSLRKIALTYPETYEEQPWGDRVVKVRGKIFFSCGTHKGLLYATVKVPRSGRKLLERPYAEPTHYGMGKHGWVTVKFDAAKKVPVEELRGWIDESFMAVAPKKLSAVGAQRSAPSVGAPKV